MRRLTAFHLKCLAITAMLINHLGHAFEAVYHPPVWQFFYLSIGLLTFPIMAYLLVDGFYYTRNRWHYVGRLGLFWIVSILPFHWLFESQQVPLYPFNNIFFTLMMGLLFLILCEKYPVLPVQYFLCILFVWLTIRSDWNVFGIPLIFAFYKNRGYQGGVRRTLFLVCLCMLWLTYPGEFSWDSPQTISWLSRLGLLLVLPVLGAYNGERGFASSWVKWGFYLFYPLHLLVLWGIRFYVFGY